ncbi:hypothetical protein EO238_31000, partial [Citrobacter sp. AAK_AS5]
MALDGALFAVWARDLIVFHQTGGFFRPLNLGRARILGSEAAAALEWARRLRFFGQVTFTDARNQEEEISVNGK